MNDSLPPDHYAALGIAKDATSAQVKTAYKKAALKHHPDKAQDKAAAADQFHKISLAYETLVDDEKRRKYEDSLKFAQLQRNLQERRGGAPPSAFGGSTVHNRRPNGDGTYRASPRSPYAGPGAFSQTRIFEERKPPNRSWDEDFVPRYEDSRASSRKAPDYMGSPRQQYRSASFRQEEVRRNSYEGKPNSNSKLNTKKQQEQDVKRARKDKRFPSPSVESDSSDSEDDYGSRQRGRREGDSTGRSQAPRRDQSREAYDDRAQSKYDQASEYIAQSRPSHRREAFQQYQPQPRERPGPEPRRDSYDSRPGMRRTPSTTHAETFPQNSRTRTTSAREVPLSRRGSHTPEEDHRPPPRMPESVSAPSGGGKLPTMVNSNPRRATHPDENNKSGRQTFRRAETTPSLNQSDSMRSARYQPAPPRRRSEQHQPSSNQPLHGHSHLRQQENNNDSGYSTSNSPSEEVPPEKENVASTKKSTYHYGAGTYSTVPRAAHVDSDTSDSEDERRTMPANVSSFKNTNVRQPVTELRTPGPTKRTPQVSRSTSPTGETGVPRSRANSTSSTKHQPFQSYLYTPTDRASGPPPSLPAKFASDHYMGPSSTSATHGSASDRERDPAPPSSRAGSRRPSISGRTGSSSKITPLNRANSMPIHVDTANVPTNRSKEGLLFNEITSSPQDMYNRSDGERRGSPSDRDTRDVRDKRRGSERRHEEPHRRGKREDDKTRKAMAYMRDGMRTRSPRQGIRA